MIETTVLDYLSDELSYPVYMSRPETAPEYYYLLEKSGSSVSNHIYTATFMIQSIAPTLYEAAVMNDSAKTAMDALISLGSVSKSTLNSDYNYTDPATKAFRYQCVYDIVHF